MFPNEEIFKAKDYSEMQALVEARSKKRKNQLTQVGIASSTLGQAKRDKNNSENPFRIFPRDVLIEIAKRTVDEGVLSKDEIHKKATESFDRPSVPPVKPKK
ncbi:MAG: hypothetical protein NVS9B7_30060 [Flavisolibacter sp.]